MSVSDIDILRDITWNGSGRYSREDMVGARNNATTALQEKLAREKGCEYCNDASFIQSGKYVDEDGYICSINNYCIYCGRKLGSGEHE